MSILITLLRSPIGTLAMAEIRAKKMRYDDDVEENYKSIPKTPSGWTPGYATIANEDWEIKLDASPSKD